MARKEKKIKKQPKPKRVKKVKEKPEKEPKMRSSAPGRFGAWVLVIFMLAMIAFGVYKILNAPTEQGVARTIEKQMSNLDQDTVARTTAVSFAERFATDYFTFARNEDYMSKMSPYCARGVTLPTPNNMSQPTYVGAGGVEVNGRDISVDVVCRVAYSTDNEKFNMIQFCTLRVPIRVDKNGNCAVVAPPLYVGNVNDTSGIDSSIGTIYGDNSKTITAINTTIKNFFDVYYGGKPSELKYYVTKNYGPAATTGLGIKVTDMKTNVKANNDKWDAECDLNIDNNGISQTQHCYLEIVKGAEGRFYINKLYTIN